MTQSEHDLVNLKDYANKFGIELLDELRKIDLPLYQELLEKTTTLFLDPQNTFTQIVADRQRVFIAANTPTNFMQTEAQQFLGLKSRLLPKDQIYSEEHVRQFGREFKEWLTYGKGVGFDEYGRINSSPRVYFTESDDAYEYFDGGISPNPLITTSECTPFSSQKSQKEPNK